MADTLSCAQPVDQLGRSGFGRLVMLTHPDCDDPDRLLIAAQLNAARWAADDLYADDSELGAVPTELPPRLALAMAAMDQVAPAGEFSEQLAGTLRADRVLVALRSATEHLSRHGLPEEVVALHNRMVREFEAGARELALVPSLALQRFLRGLRAWMGGGFEWHTTNPRYCLPASGR